MLTVVFMLWSDPSWRWDGRYRYTLDHVRRAKSMFDRHLQVPHRYVLASDSLENEVGGVDTVLLPDELLRLRHRWAKLALFAPEAFDMFGERLLYSDLDVVLVDNVDPIVTGDHFRIMAGTTGAMPYNSSLILMTTGAREQVWTKFDPSKVDALRLDNGYDATDQYWIGKVLGPNERTWTEADGVLQFRKYSAPRPMLPAHARICYFAGPYDPSMPTLRAEHPWIAEHWR